MPGFGDLFAEIATAPSRDVIGELVAARNPERILVPAAGRFGAVQAIIRHGAEPSRIAASDTSLMSSIVGYLADREKRPSDLGLTLGSDVALFVEGADPDSHEYAAGLLVALRYLQIEQTNAYMRNVARDIWTGRLRYRGEVAEQLRRVVLILEGIHYEIEDVREVMAQAASAGPETFCYLNPPGNRGGYQKAFGQFERKLAWQGQKVATWRTAELRPTLERCTGAAAFVAAYAHRSTAQVPEGWHVAFCEQADALRADYLVTNQEPPVRYAVAAHDENQAVEQLPIYADEEIGPDSAISFMPCSKATALYYRDLFVHRLPSTSAEGYHLMLIDGRVATAIGLIYKHASGHSNHPTSYVQEKFGITVSSARYARLGKLFMLALTSADFGRYLHMVERRYGLKDLDGIETSSLTAHEEGKTDRSVMKLVMREPLPGGGFRLVYRARFREDTWGEVVRTWLRRWGHLSRKTGGQGEEEEQQHEQVQAAVGSD